MSLDVTLQIDPEEVAHDATVGLVGLRLIKMGGRFLRWKPDMYGCPAIAHFEFSSPHDRAQFVEEALKIPGVSIAEAQ